MSRNAAWSALIRVNDIVDRVLTVLCAVFLLAVVVTVFYQVVGRYVLQTSTPGAEETAVYSFIWMVLFGTAIGVREHSHLVADILPETMGPFLDKLITTLTYAVVLVLAFVFIRYGGEYALLGRTRFSDTMGFPMIIVYVSLPISGVAMLLFLVERLVATWSGLEVPRRDVGEHPEPGEGP